MHQLHVRLRTLLFIIVFSLGWWWGSSPIYAFSEDQQLITEAWRLVDRAYVDYTFNHLNWWNVRQEALQQPLPDREAAYAVIQSMLAKLDDPFTRLLQPDQYRSLQTTTSGELTGLGLQVSLDAESGELEVISPIDGSPAEKAGIQARDRILSIDGVTTQTLTLDEAAARMRGQVGTAVTLTVRHLKEEPKDLQLVRSHVTLNPLTTDLRTTETGQQIAYLRLNQFNANAAAAMRKAIANYEKQGVSGYLLDLRNNPGGLLQAGIEIGRLFIDDGALVYVVNRQGIESSFETDNSALTEAPLVVLINQGTASASEILAGALQDLGRAQIVGERSFGKGLIQSLFELSDGSGLAVTVARYETPLHRDINKLGIQPDLEVNQSPAFRRDQIATDQDLQYQAGLDALTLFEVVDDAA